MFPFDEAAVRRMCGAVAFANADALQRDRDVLGPLHDGDLLRARVRGTWARVDDVTLLIHGSRMQPSCSRDGGVFCRHVGALMLEVLRNPDSIVVVNAGFDDDDDFEAADSPPPPAPTLQSVDKSVWLRDEIERLLVPFSVPQMRELAKRRAVKLTGSKRDDIQAQLVTALIDPANIDDALSGLAEPLLVALDAVYMAGISGPAQAGAVASAFHALGGMGQPPLQQLQDIGLAFKADVQLAYGWQTTPHYALPRSVVSRLAPVTSYAQPAKTALKLNQKTGRAETPRGLGIDDLVLVLASEARAGRLERNTSAASAGDLLGSDEYDDEYDELDDVFDSDYLDALAFLAPPASSENPTPVTPPAWLSDDVARQLAARLDHSTEALDFAVQLMLALGILEHRSPYSLRDDRFQVLLSMPRAVRRLVLSHAWLEIGAPELFTLLFGPAGRLRLVLPSYQWLLPMQDAIADIARLVTHALGRMAPNTWYDTASLVDVINPLTRTLTPELSNLRTWSGDPKAFTLFQMQSDGTQQPIIIKQEQDWSIFLKAIVREILSGPAHWLGLVDIARTTDGSDVPAFRVTPTAAALTGRETPGDVADQPLQPLIAEDLSVLIPSGGASGVDPVMLTFLSMYGDLTDASPAGLCYQITARGAHLAFNDDTSSDSLVAFLEQQTGALLPTAAAATIERWWQGYGAIRLYDELALIELSDDLLLPELLAASKLGASVLHTFSPRLVAVDANALDAVIADLTARGYTPRLIEDA